MFRRVIGFAFILIGVTGLAICYLGARAGRDLAENVSVSADEMLETAGETLDTVESSLDQARAVVSETTETIDQVSTTTANLALAIDDTKPTLDSLAMLVGEDIPNTIGDVQETIPNIAQTAKVVDDTLRLLSKIRFEETIPIINYDISFGLGVEYDPEIPFDQAVEEVGRGLEPIATATSGLELDMQTSAANMELLSQDLNDLVADLDNLNSEVGAIRPLLDEYSFLVNDLQENIVDGRTQLQEQLSAVKKAVIVAAVWLALFQLLPLYFGVELLSGNRMVREQVRSLLASDVSGEPVGMTHSVSEKADLPNDNEEVAKK
jgi:methyl-accepting chemotaxis protein